MRSPVRLLALVAIFAGTACPADDGAIDPGFGDLGRVVLSPPDASLRVSAAITQPDGKVLLAGSRWYVGSEPFDNEVAVWRLRADGSLDPGFGVAGVSTVGFGADFAQAWDVRLDAQGRILLAGPPGFSVLRLLADGRVDTAFGVAGRASVDFADLGYAQATAYALATDDAGRVIASGSAGDGSVSSPAVARFSSAGVADPAFGDGGRVVLPQGTPQSPLTAAALAVAADAGAIVAAGTMQDGLYGFLALRLLGDGHPDPAFGTGGVAFFPAQGTGNTRARRVLLDHDRLLLVGSCDVDVDSGSLCALRLFGDGSVDTGYGSAGWAQVAPANSVRGWVCGVLQSDGKLVLGGSSPLADPADFAIGRVTADGIPDVTFGSGGVVTVSFDTPYGSDDHGYALALQGGRIVVAGDTDGVPYIRALAAVRLDNDLIFTNGLD